MSESLPYDYDFEIGSGEVDTYKASLNDPIPESNVGFKLLLKLGYKLGTGLGKEGRQGRVEPGNASYLKYDSHSTEASYLSDSSLLSLPPTLVSSLTEPFLK
jgi:hypothetical protein